MLTDKQKEEIKEHLERAQNPLIYYDNDADGLCSFLLLRRYIGRGKGIAIRSFPDLNRQYAKRAEELKADYVFILDKPVVSKEFIDEIDKLGLPLVWIDHHEVEQVDTTKYSNVSIYNWSKNKGKEKSDEPVTYAVYAVTKRKEDVWIAMMGCIADHFIPDFTKEFVEEYKEYWGSNIEEPFDAYYDTEIGKIARALTFGLKDSTTHIVELQNYLIRCKNPGEVLAEEKGNEALRKKYAEVRKKYEELVKKGEENIEGNMIFFVYGGETSISSEIANELVYRNKGKYVAVVYKKEGIANVSLRGKNVKKILENVLKKLENASGGGHEDAVGARIKAEDIELFKEELRKEIEKL